MIAPYYDEDGITIYHGDCREILPTLTVGAIVTDPPYGINADRAQASRAGRQHGRALAPSRDYGASDWDKSRPSQREMGALLGAAPHAIIWGGNYFGLPGSSGWLVWDKMTGSNGYADCELAWTNIPMAVRLIRFQWMGMLQQLPETRWHPTQKPLPVMKWSLGFLPDPTGPIVDPYMGSGTTLRAAKDLGRKAIGIEIEERYCEIAAKRLGQMVLDLEST